MPTLLLPFLSTLLYQLLQINSLSAIQHNVTQQWLRNRCQMQEFLVTLLPFFNNLSIKICINFNKLISSLSSICPTIQCKRQQDPCCIGTLTLTRYIYYTYIMFDVWEKGWRISYVNNFSHHNHFYQLIYVTFCFMAV